MKKLKHVDLFSQAVTMIDGKPVDVYQVSQKRLDEWKNKRTYKGKKVTAEVAEALF